MQSVRLQPRRGSPLNYISLRENNSMPRVESCAVEGVQKGEKGNYRCFLDARLGKRIPRLGMITNLTPVLAFVCPRKP